MTLTIRHKKPHSAGPITFDYRKPFLRMILPTGRALHYLRPAVEAQMKPWGKVKATVTYEGWDQKTHQWTRVSTHPGKVMENADQATAREILVEALVSLGTLGCETVVDIHDEVVVLTREDGADDEFAIVSEVMNARPSWRKDMPLSATGYVSPWFVKD